MKIVQSICVQLIVLIALSTIIESKSIVEFLNLDQDAKVKFIGLAAKCMADHKPSEKLIEDLRALKFTEDKNIKCYVNCLMSGFGVYKDNAFDLDKVKGIMHEKDRKMAEECTKQTGANDCDIVYLFYKCVMIHFHA